MSISEDQLEPLNELERGGLDEADLAGALDANRAHLEVLGTRMEQLEQAMVRARKEQHLLEGLLALRRGQDVDPASGPVVNRTMGQPATAVSNGVAEAAVGVLEKVARPMHIGELMSALLKDGVEIPGAGAQANLIAHLRRDNRIARPSRGMYGLKALGIEEYHPKKRTTPRKRSRKARAQKKRTRS